MLASQGRSLDQVPADGERVYLRQVESARWGGEVDEVTQAVHPDNMSLAERVAALVGLNNAGVDLITTDISRPWHENAAVVNEVNHAPQFGATSAAREKMHRFVRDLMEGDGRIPVEACVGGPSALDRARALRAARAATGIACWLASHDTVLDGTGRPFPIAAEGLFERTLALLMDRRVEALVLAVQTDEFLRTGLPVDRLVRIHDCGGEPRATATVIPPADSAARPAADSGPALLRLLELHAGEAGTAPSGPES